MCKEIRFNCALSVSPSAHQVGFPTKERVEPTLSQTLPPSTHFLSKKKEDQEYHHLSYKWDDGQAPFQFTAVKLEDSTSYLFPGEKNKCFFFVQKHSRTAKVWQQLLPAFPNQAYTQTQHHHVPIKNFKLAIPAEFNVW